MQQELPVIFRKKWQNWQTADSTSTGLNSRNFEVWPMFTYFECTFLLLKELYRFISLRLLYLFLTYEAEFVLFLAVLENSVLPIGWDSSHTTFKVTSKL
ncbi:MAG: hypothetical protein AB2705_22245 [Candidatus Thiodiazotropha sp.]